MQDAAFSFTHLKRKIQKVGYIAPPRRYRGDECMCICSVKTVAGSRTSGSSGAALGLIFFFPSFFALKRTRDPATQCVKTLQLS